jgi:hypothetical protein
MFARRFAWRTAPQLAIAAVALGACASAPPPSPSPVVPVISEPPVRVAEDDQPFADVPTFARELVATAERHRVAALTPSTLTHANLWKHLGPLIDKTRDARRSEIGKSVQGRPLYAIDLGRGQIRVLLWSQMHGDEPTATLALTDLVGYILSNENDPLVRRLKQRLSITAILMLNPDGAELGRRENARGIDLNRDARSQVSPEARALAAIHARLSPHFGFNLHDQSARVGEDGRPVAIALLAPPHNDTPGTVTHTRAKRLAAVMRLAADSLVDGRVARYDESHNPQAFGDAMQSWGTSTVLLETGSWQDDKQKDYLRSVNFAVLLVALDAIATGALERADLSLYESLQPGRAPGTR